MENTSTPKMLLEVLEEHNSEYRINEQGICRRYCTSIRTYSKIFEGVYQ